MPDAAFEAARARARRGPFRLTAVFFGVPLAIFSTEMLDRKHDHAPHMAEEAALLTFVVTGVALTIAELIG